jgi:hypothetical protein
MSFTYNPIDMDGIPWTSDFRGIIQNLSITFYGEGSTNRSSLKRGETKLLEFKISEDQMWSFKINAVHPLTGKFFEATITNSGNVISRPSSIDVRVNAEIVSDGAIELKEVSVLPTAICFFEMQTVSKALIDIKTASPIVTSILANTVSIDINEKINKYKYEEVEESGIIYVNGIEPINGNIDIIGVGQTSVNIDSGKLIRHVVGVD